MLSVGHLSCDINGGALPAALPYVRAAHNLDYQATGGLMLAYSCLSSLIQPILGLLADRHKKPWFVPFGILLAGGGLGSLAFMNNYWSIFLGIAISGIGAAVFHPEGARYVNRSSGAQKGSGMSLFSIGGNSGYILGPIVVTVFLGAYGLAGMSVFAAIGVVMAVVLAFGIARLPGGSKNRINAMTQAELSAEDPPGAEADELASNDGNEPEATNNWREFSKLLMVIVSRAIIFAGCNTFIPLYWINVYGQTKAAGAMALVVFGACGVACNILGGYLTDKFGSIFVIRCAYSLMAPFLLAFGFSSNVFMAWALVPCLGLALYLPFSAQVVLGQTLLAKNVGFASGVTLGLAVSLGGIAQPVLGWLADGWGLPAIFIAIACQGVFGATFSFLLKGEKKPA